MRVGLLLLGLTVSFLVGCERKPANDAVADSQQIQDTASLSAPVVDMQGIDIKRSISAKKQLAGGLSAVNLSLSIKPKKCRSSCTHYQVSWLFFPDQPNLNEAVLQGLFSTDELSESASITKRDFASADQLMRLFIQQGALFIAEAAEYRQRWSTDLELKHELGRAGILVLSIDDARYTGGAHGSFHRQYLNWDASQTKMLSLGDIILPEQEQAYWSEVEQSYEDWLRGLDNPESILEGWPFERTQNFALQTKHLRMQYQAYELGPYSEGMPSFDLPYARLNLIILPQFVND
jgi:hypothetical protein